MRLLTIAVFFTGLMAIMSPAQAQQTTWVQVAAERSLNDAQNTVRDYAGRLPNVHGFRANSGWYAIALGPFSRAEADSALRQLRATGQIPSDSFIAFSSGFARKFWPIGDAAVTTPTEAPPEPEPVVLIPAEETPQEARRSERDLTRAERELLQTAMQWEGHYTAAIDGAFGPGTRNAMGSWQIANGYEPTGVLTTKQRRQLVDTYQAMLESIGLATITDTTAGIEIILPNAMIEFDAYSPPFAKYSAAENSGVSVMLISQTGDEASLRGLYDILQTLEMVPLEGERSIGKSSFTLTGANSQISTYAFARLTDGHVKGFVLTWPAGEDRRRNVVIDAMANSFAPLSDSVLPDVYGDPNAAQSLDLLAGLAIRQPDVSRSGFYIDDQGSVLTTTQVIGQCSRIMLDDTYEAEVVGQDAQSGLALLKPLQSLTPITYAQFSPYTPRLNSEVAVSGYSYEGQLGAPTLTYGTLADVKGLNGERSLKRLALRPAAGDAGGPVFDQTGSVFGMLLPTEQNGRKLPEDVSFAADADGISSFLAGYGMDAMASDETAAIAPEDLTIAAADMTVLVSCWN